MRARLARVLRGLANRLMPQPDFSECAAYAEEIAAWTATEFPPFWADWNSAEDQVWDGPRITHTAGPGITVRYR